MNAVKEMSELYSIITCQLRHVLLLMNSDITENTLAVHGILTQLPLLRSSQFLVFSHFFSVLFSSFFPFLIFSFFIFFFSLLS